MARRRMRNLVFTVNNYTTQEYEILLAHEMWSYVVIGKEIGKSKTPHLQGYGELTKQRTIKWLTRQCRGFHVAKRMGTAKQAADYCKKDDNYEERGTMSKQGRRTDIEELVTRVALGERLTTIILDCPTYNIMRMVEKLASYRQPTKVYDKRTVHWFWGETGKGKTKMAYEMVEEGNFWLSNDHQWFDGYDGQEIALIDELRAKNWPYSLMLKLLDGYPLRLPVKGGFTIWEPKVIIITTPFPPEKTYAGTAENVDGGIQQLIRRITNIREFI